MRIAKVTVIALLVLLLTLGAVSTRAAGPLLQGGFMGLNITPPPLTAFSTGRAPAFAGSLGLRLSPQWRIGAEISYTEHGNGAGGETQSQVSMVNLYYDFDVGKSRFRPFLSIGAGLTSDGFYKGGIDGLGISSSTSTTLGGVWQAGGGLTYQLDNDLMLSGGYRHLGYTNGTGASVSSRDGSHEVRVGVTWKLPVKRNRGLPGE